MSQVRVIAIDGPSGSGKGTIAELVAERLGWRVLDSGAIYRVLGLLVQRAGVAAENTQAVCDLATRMGLTFEHGSVLLDGENVSSEIRTETAGNNASKVAAIPQVRKALLDWQRNYATEPGLVADGRDMGTVVFPRAEVKIFLTASAEERAQRRYKQLKEKGLSVNLAALTAEIQERDERDRNRSVAPLLPAPSALQVDSTQMSIVEVVDLVMEKVIQAWPDLR